MNWYNFLRSICNDQKYELTLSEQEVTLCIEETQSQTKNDLLKAYNKKYTPINEEAFTQRLKNIYRKFQITEKGHKLPQLHKYLVNKYSDYQKKEIFFSEIGLDYIYSNFPHDKFTQA